MPLIDSVDDNCSSQKAPGEVHRTIGTTADLVGACPGLKSEEVIIYLNLIFSDRGGGVALSR